MTITHAIRGRLPGALLRTPAVAAGAGAMIALLALSAAPAAPPRAGEGADLARRAMAGDAQAPASIESLVEPLFARKDLWALDAGSAGRECARLLGVGAESVGWFVLATEGSLLRVLSLDLGSLGQSAERSRGYVAYAIVEKAPEGEPRVSWYHDLGRKLEEQGGTPWVPRSVRLLSDGSARGGRSLAVEAGPRAGRESTGLLLLEEQGSDWTATRRVTPPGGGRLVGCGPDGAVFLTPREPSKGGVLTGVPAGLFRSLVYFERQGGAFSTDPVVAPVPDVVTAAEALLAALRRGDKDEARRLCTTPDVLEAMLYFSPGWKGGGRVVRADPGRLEIVYEERDRPTLRLDLTFQSRGGVLLLGSITGRAEDKKEG